jgi:hypothetical protein
MKAIQICSKERPGPLEREDNYKNLKTWYGHLNIFFSNSVGLAKLKFPWKNSSLFKSRPQRVGCGHNRKNYFTDFFYIVGVSVKFKSALLTEVHNS